MNYNPTIVEYFAESEPHGHRCGYCKSPNTNFSNGMWAHTMTCQDYQDLIDRGWRRSGKYCYKPTMNITCCPMYTIRCKALDFQMNKSHKKVIKKVNKYLISGNKGDSDNTSSTEVVQSRETASEHSGIEEMLSEKGEPSNIQSLSKSKEPKSKSPSQTKSKDTFRLLEGTAASEVSLKDAQQPASASGGDKKLPRPGAGADPSKPACKKAKQIRLERHLSKKQMREETNTPIPKEEKKTKAKTLEDFLSEPDHTQNCAHKLEIRLVRSTPPSQAFSSSFDESHRVYESYQMKIHRDPPGKANAKQYKRFLCDSPLVEEHKENGPSVGYGSFHQQYLLDGKIIAVGVIDILPHSVSSVYLYYDPEYDFLNLGTYSALREISFVRELSKTAPSIQNYYMGFYIHTCPKMRYKGQYSPSFLVCPETYSWIPIEKCLPVLDTKRYSRLEEEGVEEKDKVDDLSKVLVLYKNSVMPYEVYRTTRKNKNADYREVKEYANFVGRPCAERMLLLRSK